MKTLFLTDDTVLLQVQDDYPEAAFIIGVLFSKRFKEIKNIDGNNTIRVSVRQGESLTYPGFGPYLMITYSLINGPRKIDGEARICFARDTREATCYLGNEIPKDCRGNIANVIDNLITAILQGLSQIYSF